jgi:SH3-like domain-containing protein
VEWEVALVRDSPKTGKVIARLPRGSQVRVGPVKDGWYPVTYGSGYSSEGWVYRGAIGR